MTTEFTDANDEVRPIAGELIPTHHRHLIGVHIEFVFRDPAAKKAGRVALGTAQKVSGLNAHLADWGEDAFVIVLARTPWIDMTPRQRKALVDHELSHCQVDDDGALHVIGHDLEEFVAVVERNGLWRSDVAEFGKVAAAQLRLRLEEAS